MTITYSATVLDKARRLVADQAVTRIGNGSMWRVAGDSATYTVAIEGVDADGSIDVDAIDYASCTCPAGQIAAQTDRAATCSHAAAVLLVIREAVAS